MRCYKVLSHCYDGRYAVSTDFSTEQTALTWAESQINSPTSGYRGALIVEVLTEVTARACVTKSFGKE